MGCRRWGGTRACAPPSAPPGTRDCTQGGIGASILMGPVKDAFSCGHASQRHAPSPPPKPASPAVPGLTAPSALAQPLCLPAAAGTADVSNLTQLLRLH